MIADRGSEGDGASGPTGLRFVRLVTAVLNARITASSALSEDREGVC